MSCLNNIKKKGIGITSIYSSIIFDKKTFLTITVITSEFVFQCGIFMEEIAQPLVVLFLDIHPPAVVADAQTTAVIIPENKTS